MGTQVDSEPLIGQFFTKPLAPTNFKLGQNRHEIVKKAANPRNPLYHHQTKEQTYAPSFSRLVAHSVT